MPRITTALCAALACALPPAALAMERSHHARFTPIHGGTNFCVQRDFEGTMTTVAPENAQGHPMKFSPAGILFTQRSCGGKGRGAKLLAAIGDRGWQPGNNPIDVVDFGDYAVTLDNTRVAVAQKLGLKEISGCVHRHDDPLPHYYVESARFANVDYRKIVEVMKGHGLPDWNTVTPARWMELAKVNHDWQRWAETNVARTWGQAVHFRWGNNKIKNATQAVKTNLNIKAEQTPITAVVSDESARCLHDGVCSGEGAASSSQVVQSSPPRQGSPRRRSSSPPPGGKK